MRKLFWKALGFTVLQVGIFLWVNGGKYGLLNWDAAWYHGVAERGYIANLPLSAEPEHVSNLAFFPGFPVWIRLVHALIPVDFKYAVNLASQLAAVGAWAYFFLLLRQLGARPGSRRETLMGYLFFILPGAFYFVAGYSEPLFVLGLLGMIYWTLRAFESERVWVWGALLAIAHGGVLSGTRLLGAVLVCFPVLLVLCESVGARTFRWKRIGISALMSLGALWGFLAFLAYCQLRWGTWDMYWQANRYGWNSYYDPWILLTWSYYRDVFFAGNLPQLVGRALTVVSLVAIVLLAVRGWKARATQPARLAIALLLLGFLLETIVGSHGMHSMTRYILPVDALLIPLWATRDPESSEEGLLASALKWMPLWLALFAIQVVFIQRFCTSQWVS